MTSHPTGTMAHQANPGMHASGDAFTKVRGYEVRKVMILAVSAVVVGFAVVATAAPGKPPLSSCLGLTPTIVGTPGADVINGTTGAE